MIRQLRIHWYSRNITVIPQKYYEVLDKYNEYYRNLSPVLKEDFVKRLYISLKFVEFEPIQFDKVTEEMKIVILSALIQITFGLDKYVLSEFKTFLVVPNIYKYGGYPALHGHVDHAKKQVVLAWPSVKNGFIIPADAHNVALHELAHVLQEENYRSLFFADFFDAIAVNQWESEGLKELWKIRRKEQNYLGEYAGQNMLELFAVSIECFFEQPDKFAESVPGLFLIMTRLLKQTPTNRSVPLLYRVVD